MLTAQEIEMRLGTDIFINPYDGLQLNPNSYNLKLGRQLLRYTDPILDCKKENAHVVFDIPDEGYVLQPDVLVLGHTLEYTKTFNLVPQIEGRSSLARLGISVHLSAGFGDIGFCGYWTLEFSVVQPVRIYYGMPIAQIIYHPVEGSILKQYKGKYSNNEGIQSSMLHKDF